jgi:hypothetical protein
MQTDRGFVYLARYGDFIKIGYSANPEQRRGSLGATGRRSLPAVPEGTRHLLAAAMPGSRATERALHLAYRDDHAAGEYFHCRGHLAEWVRRLEQEHDRFADAELDTEEELSPTACPIPGVDF